MSWLPAVEYTTPFATIGTDADLPPRMVTADAVGHATKRESGAHVVQQSAESGGNASQPKKETPVFAGVCEALHDAAGCLVGPEGLEPPTNEL